MAETVSIERLREANRKFRDRQYAELKAANSRLYFRCVEYAEGLAFKHGLSASLTAEIEAALVAFAWENFSG